MSVLETVRSALVPLHIPHAAAPGLVAYAELLHEWNRSLRFFSRSDGSSLARIVERHVIDSCLAASVFDREIGRLRGQGAEHVRIFDLGSGPGLPGLPLAIVLPEMEAGGADTVHLIERGTRRADFLRYAVRELALERVVVEPVDLGAVVPGDDAAAIVTFRALSPLGAEVLKTIAARFPVGSTLLAYQALEPAPALRDACPGGTSEPLPSRHGGTGRSLFRATLPC